MPAEQKLKKVDDLSFEEALAELETIVRDLESGQGALDQSIESYERGVALKTHCEKQLKAAHSKIEKITVTENGEIITENFNIEE